MKNIILVGITKKRINVYFLFQYEIEKQNINA